MIESHTAILERETAIRGAYETEPYESAWAREAIFFVREHGDENGAGAHTAVVQISPDGMHWCDDGTIVEIEPGRIARVKVGHFGGWLRIRGEVPPGAELVVSIQLSLKG